MGEEVVAHAGKVGCGKGDFGKQRKHGRVMPVQPPLRAGAPRVRLQKSADL
jgi:hypothetical protein